MKCKLLVKFHPALFPIILHPNYPGESALSSVFCNFVVLKMASMQKLNLPEYPVKLKSEAGKTWIFDAWRKKYIVLTPEEWVRQNFLHFLVDHKNFPESLIAVESGLKVVARSKRTDALVYAKSGKPLVLIECKAPEVEITPKVFDQIVRYNITLQVKYLMVTNGLAHFCCVLDYTDNSWNFLKEIPDYYTLI